jgi:hypothetical protein
MCCEFLAKKGFAHPDLARCPISLQHRSSIELPWREDFVLIASVGQVAGRGRPQLVNAGGRQLCHGRGIAEADEGA